MRKHIINKIPIGRSLAAEYGFAALLCTLFAILNIALVTVSNSTVHVEVTSPTEGIFQIFWKNSNNQYSEVDSTKVDLIAGRQQLMMRIPSPVFLQSFRVDFIDSQNSVHLHKLDLQHPLFSFTSPLHTTDSVLSSFQVASIKEDDDQGWLIKADGDDPHLEISVNESPFLAVIAASLAIAPVVAVLLSLLVNENRLKGPLNRAILVVDIPNTLEAQQKKNLIAAITRNYPSKGLHSATHRNGATVYRFILTLKSSAEALSLLKWLHDEYAGVTYHLQFSRAGMIRPTANRLVGLRRSIKNQQASI